MTASKYFLLCAILLLSSCGSKTVRYDLDAKTKSLRPAIIFIPGFYGSALADEKTGERFFLTSWGAVFSGTPLAITTPDLGVDGAHSLRADGVLEYLRIIPGLYSVNVYGDTLDFLRDTFKETAEIVPFDYDWRQEISQSARKLDLLVKSLQAAGVPQILFVAHSMGGLVATYYLRYGSQDPLTAIDNGEGAKQVSATVIAGTPFGGSAYAFRNLQTGTSLGPADAPLTAASMGTFGSMYQLLPNPDGKAYLNSNGEPLGKEVFSPEVWKKKKMGLFRKRGEVSAVVQARREAYVTQALQKGESFISKVRTEKGNGPSPAMLYLVGTGIPTVSHALWSRPTLAEEGKWLYDDESVQKAFPGGAKLSLISDGDNTVPAVSATPPAGLLRRLPGRVITGMARHEAILDDKTFRTAVETFLKKHLLGRPKTGVH